MLQGWSKIFGHRFFKDFFVLQCASDGNVGNFRNFQHDTF